MPNLTSLIALVMLKSHLSLFFLLVLFDNT